MINKGTNVVIVKEFMEECIKDPNGVLPGKTIFFCMTIAHARRVEKILDALYPEYSGELAKVMTSDDPRVYGKGGLLDQFTNKDMPRIAISVDMLDTGIDVRELVNLVFVKPVYSYTKFWQMIGRGTRLLEAQKIKPWCPVKDKFLIIDCWNNFEYFKLNPKGREASPQIPLPVRYFDLRLEKIAVAKEKEEKEILEKEISLLRAQINNLPEKSVVIQEAKADLSKVKADSYWKVLSDNKFDFLRNVIKPLFRTVSQVDFKSMRFEKDVLETSLAHLSKDEEKLEILIENMQTQVEELPTSVNLVAKHETVINNILTQKFWDEIVDENFDEIAEKLAPLMKFRRVQKPGTGKMYLDIKDVLQTKEMVEFGPQNEAVSITQYREMVEEKIKAMIDQHPILQKIKNGEPIDEMDIN